MMTRKLCALAVGAIMAMQVGTASAATTTYNFTGGANPAGPFTLGCMVGGPLNVGCAVTFNAAGLGIDGQPDLFGGPGQIDGIPGFETLIVSFTEEVRLDGFLLGRFGGDDDYELSLNGGAFSPSQTLNPNAVGQNVTSFAIRASAGPGEGFFGFGNDEFTLKAFRISAVPLPPGIALLASGFGLMALARRRRRAA